MESIRGLALNLGKVKFAELVTVPAQRAGCVTPSDDAVLMRTARGFCPLVVLLMLEQEFLSYSGNTEGMWCVFQYADVPRACLQRAVDIRTLGSCGFPALCAGQCEAVPAAVAGRKNVPPSTGSAPRSKWEHRAMSWQPLLPVWPPYGPLILVSLREHLMVSGLQFWGAAQPYRSNSFSHPSRSSRGPP